MIIGVTPEDVRDSVSSAYRLTLDTLINRINHCLILEHFTGPGELRIPLFIEALPESARRSLIHEYRAWEHVRFDQEDGAWVIYIEGKG